MARRDPQSPGRPRDERRDRLLLIVGLAVAAALVLASALALVIHFMLLSTDRFNWLEEPKRSDVLSPTHIAASPPARREGQDAAM